MATEHFKYGQSKDFKDSKKKITFDIAAKIQIQLYMFILLAALPMTSVYVPKVQTLKTGKKDYHI